MFQYTADTVQSHRVWSQMTKGFLSLLHDHANTARRSIVMLLIHLVCFYNTRNEHLGVREPFRHSDSCCSNDPILGF
jgi:hypothetical protein